MIPLDVASLRAHYAGPHDLVRTFDGKTLFLRRWDGSRKSPVSVLVFHGITAHSAPYGPILAEELARAGVTVYGMDLRGHGLSDGVRGDYPSDAAWVNDLTATLSYVKARTEKLVVLGHSLGVLSAVRSQQLRPADIAGVVLLSAARQVRTEFRPRPSAAEVLKALLGIAVLRGTPLIEIAKREGMVGLDDPLFNFRYSARFYSVLYGMGALRVSRMFREGFVDSPYFHFAEKLHVPLLVGVGDQDESFPVESVRAFFDSVDADRKEFVVIPGARHAVFSKECWGPLIAWLAREF